MSNFRQWYAMRKSLQQRGKWSHAVPAQEEGEPEPKQGRWYESTNAGLDVAANLPEKSPTPGPASTPDSIPPLEASPTEEGTSWHIQASVSWPGYAMIPQ